MSINASALRNARPNATSTVTLGLVNACSIRNKTDVFTDQVIDANIDLMAITETWLSPGDKDTKTVKELTPVGYKFVHAPRKNRRGVVPAFCADPSLKSPSTTTTNRQCNNSNLWTLTSRLPLATSSWSLYIVRFSCRVCRIHRRLCHDAICLFAMIGDFNIHWDKSSDCNEKRFADLID